MAIVGKYAGKRGEISWDEFALCSCRIKHAYGLLCTCVVFIMIIMIIINVIVLLFISLSAETVDLKYINFDWTLARADCLKNLI